MGRRLLFVDDEELLRELYSSFDAVLGEENEIVTASGGKEALEILRQKPVDVIVSDLAMPEMDGVEFLSTVVREHPESARIVISGFADRVKIAECLSVGHRFFNKPLNCKSLTALLRRICQYSHLVADERVRRIICGENALPTPPDTYLELTELLNSAYSDLDDVGRIVERDPGLTTKLLHIVNSAHFGTGRQISTPAEAVQLVGVEVLRALILGTKVFHFYEQTPFLRQTFGDLWNHSLETAVAARKIARAEGLVTKECEDCFLAALLHDIGKLILASGSEVEYRMVLASVQGENWSLCDAEKKVFGSTHAEVGAYLLVLWGIADKVIKAVETHHSETLGDSEGLTPQVAIHVAQNLRPERENLLNRPLLEKLGLLGRIDDWKDAIADRS